MQTSLRFNVLGPLHVIDGDDLLTVGGKRERSALSALLFTPCEAISVARMSCLMWSPGDEPRDPAHAVRTHVMRLRRHLGADVVRTGPGSYATPVPSEAVDAHRFQQAATAATAALEIGQLGEAEALLTATLDRWHQGEPWLELADVPAVVAERARLVELRLQIEERLAAVRLSLHRPEDGLLAQLASEQPLREQRWMLLIRAHFNAGRQADALRSYQRARFVLRDELGIEPGPQLKALERRVLAQDQSLREASVADLLEV